MLNSELNHQELVARLTLHSTILIGPSRYQALINYFGSALEATRATSWQWQQLGMPAQSWELSRNKATEQEVNNALNWLEKPQHQILFSDSPDFPPLLCEVQGAPFALFVEGNSKQLEQPQLAMVGSRQATPAGADIAFSFAKAMASAGCAITSGMATGIDSHAHQGALAANGVTIAVVGTGLAHTYPKRNLKLREAIVANNGCLVSEFPLTTSPIPSNFPRRNRIISGLALGVLVVEASLASGSLITARYAGEQNRDVFAIPGSIHSPASKGCHQLIRDGAILVESVQDILSQWQHWQNWPSPTNSLTGDSKPNCPLLKLLQSKASNTDELLTLLSWPLPQLMSRLTELELEAAIRFHGGLWHYLPSSK